MLYMKIRFVRWDWREQPDMSQLESALSEVFDGKDVPLSRPKREKRYIGPDRYCSTYVRIVPHDVIKSDETWAVIANERIDDAKAIEIYKAYPGYESSKK